MIFFLWQVPRHQLYGPELSVPFPWGPHEDLQDGALAHAHTRQLQAKVNCANKAPDQYFLYRSSSLGFLGRVPSVTTLSLNKNDIQRFDVALNVSKYSLLSFNLMEFLGGAPTATFASP